MYVYIRLCTCLYVYVRRNVRSDGRTVKRVGRTFVRFEKIDGQMYRPENVRTYGRTHGGVSTVHLIGYSAVKYAHTQRSKLKCCLLPCKDRSKYVCIHARTYVHVYVHGCMTMSEIRSDGFSLYCVLTEWVMLRLNGWEGGLVNECEGTWCHVMRCIGGGEGGLG